MTAEDWKKVEAGLSEWDYEELLIDGYYVQLQLTRDKLALVIAVFVNKKFNGKWLREDCEERRRFMCHSERCMIGRYNKKMGFTKKEYEKLKKEYTFPVYSNYFKSFRTLKSQFIEHNNSIELVGKDEEDFYDD